MTRFRLWLGCVLTRKIRPQLLGWKIFRLTNWLVADALVLRAVADILYNRLAVLGHDLGLALHILVRLVLFAAKEVKVLCHGLVVLLI